ncbi:cytochrome b5 [Thecamonas trahens ATCC 50062]|uniref:Cytochrome b5 n=1 Tax=Thecamonas trahens ATCC 50062 TaxID=461836 RepID=A0A0L0DGF2_THETB|nr:cytochrome b5 [Thecamonas trahens ATCC 50062]KNC51265.1 cytochrome b5 [Thecamonas trahens ATCC 50062]|eukprot:XP_013756194.1 cytochrome b5 [Thecamonas trahens ATCC 50062]
MSKTFELAEVAEHNTAEDCWIVIDNKVYDVTAFIDDHPGGAEVLLDVAGEDGTDGFEDVGHSSEAVAMLKDYLVGDVDPAEVRERPAGGAGAGDSWCTIL